MYTLTDNDLEKVVNHYNEIGEKFAHTNNSASRIKYKAQLDEIYQMLCMLRILHKFIIVNSKPPFMRLKK